MTLYPLSTPSQCPIKKNNGRLVTDSAFLYDENHVKHTPTHIHTHPRQRVSKHGERREGSIRLHNMYAPIIKYYLPSYLPNIMIVTADAESPTKWLRILRVIIGLTCIALSVIIITGAPKLGLYMTIFLGSTSLIFIGIERIVTGLRTADVKKLSRIINVAIGLGIVIFFGSGFFNPDFMAKWYSLLLGFGLLANGGARVVSGLKNNEYKKTSKFTDFGIGAISAIMGLVVLVFPRRPDLFAAFNGRHSSYG